MTVFRPGTGAAQGVLFIGRPGHRVQLYSEGFSPRVLSLGLYSGPGYTGQVPQPELPDDLYNESKVK